MTSFLIVRLGALGDIVHAIPVAAALRRSFPRARIDWLVSVTHREILDLVPVVDRIVAITDRRDTRGGIPLWSAVKHLRQHAYDVAIDLQGLIKSALIARVSGAPRVIGFDSKYARESLASLFYTDVHHPGGDGIYASSETRHVVEINLGLLTRLGVSADTPEFPLRIAESAPLVAACGETEGRYALLNPGAAWPNKRWPAERFGALAAALRDRHRLRSVVLWGPGERAIAEQVVACADGAAILAQNTTVADVAALARRAVVMVSGDTGPMHIGAAVGAPMVGIYGPTRPERNGPWSADDRTVSRAAVCRCHHLRRCRAVRMCLSDIAVTEVLDAVECRLAASTSRV